MATYQISATTIRAGRWSGLLRAGAGDAPDPQIEITHLERPLDGVLVQAAAPGSWAVSVPVPADLLSDGVQTFVVSDRQSGERLGHFTIITGVPLEDDLRAEIDLLRAELDMLKRAFRRHCLETGS